MYPVVLLLLSAVAYLLAIFYKWTKVSSRMPPGPSGTFLLGTVEFLRTPDRNRRIMDMGKQYGGLISTRAGVQRYVWITSYRLFRQAIVDRPWDFADRPPEVQLGNLPRGIVASGLDEHSKQIRKFTLLTLRNFGFGKNDMQDIMLQETDDLLREFRNTAGQPFNPRLLLSITTANVMCGIMLNRHYQPDHEGIRVVTEALTEGFKLMILAARAAALPGLKYLPNQVVTKYEANLGYCKEFVQSVVHEHEGSWVAGSPRDYIDAWLDEAHKHGTGAFSHDTLYSALIDLFAGGFETTTTTLQWVIIVILHHPEVQRKIHQELDGVINGQSQVTLNHRDSLVYVEAVILETLRLFTVFPAGVPHMAPEDGELNGFLIPKGTRVMLHLYSIHHDPDLWNLPEEFLPERFIMDGQLKVPEYFLPFSAGRRACIGEQLARKELFLIFANIMNNFVISNPVGQKLPTLKVDGAATVVLHPEPFEIQVTPR